MVLDEDGKIREKAGVEETPYYLIVSPDGKVAFSGGMEPEKWNHYLGLLLAGRPLEPYVEKAPAWG